MATLSKFSGQYPFYSMIASNHKNMYSLHRFEENGNATAVGNNYAFRAGNPGGGASYGWGYKNFGKAFYMDSNAQTFGPYCYKYTNGDPYWKWQSGYTYVVKAAVHTANIDGAAGGMICDQSDHGGAGNGHRVGFNNNYTTVYWGLYNGSTGVNLGSNVNYVDFTDGKVHTIIYVAESASSHKLYVDGKLHDSSTTSISPGFPQNSFNSFFGADSYSDGINGMTGWVDEFAVFNKAFTAKEAYAYGGALLV